MAKGKPTYLSRFQVIRPEYRATQEEALQWLASARGMAENSASFQDPETLLRARRLIERYSCGPDQVRFRNSALRDFIHRDWAQMSVFRLKENPSGTGISHRNRVFDEITDRVFGDFYPAGGDSRSPSAILHVTCTGYSSPSAAQRLVGKRGWGKTTSVIHAYHMGCYAAIPAIRISTALAETGKPVDVVHTEVCTLHFNPAESDPEQIVVQSLFSDGFVKYTVQADSPEDAGLEILAVSEEILPESSGDMTWAPSESGMRMTLSRDVPRRLTGSIRDFLDRLFANAGIDGSRLGSSAAFAIHPGGPKIIDMLQERLLLRPDQVKASREVFRENGNMSSATLPHIWNNILNDPDIRPGTLIPSLAFGPGLTLCGAVLRKA